MRTHFSDQKWLAKIRHDDIDEVCHILEYFMWDSSTKVMREVGVPTNDDVHQWITVLSHRVGSETEAIQQQIKSCEEFCNNPPQC